MSEGSRSVLGDLRALAEVLADVLAERGLVFSGTAQAPARVLSAAEVGRLLGRDRKWVYDHAGELGAFRYGDGPRARIGFDVVTVERWKRERQIRQPRRTTRSRGSSRRAAALSLIPYDGASGET